MAARPTTAFYGLPLPRESDQDWGSDMNLILSLLTGLLAGNQKPANVTIHWGDKTNSRYISCSPQGVQLHGDVNYSLGLVKNFRFNQGSSFPVDYAVGVPFYRTDENTLYLRTASGWVAIALITQEAVDAAGAVMVADAGEGEGNIGNIFINLGEGNIGVINPAGQDGRLLVVDEGEPGRWSFVDAVDAFAAAYPSQGALFAGIGAGDGQFIELPEDANLNFFVRDAGAAAGMAWWSALSAVGLAFGGQGELLAGTGANTAAAVPWGASNGMVLIRDAAEPTGVRWAEQSELGSVPNRFTQTNAQIFAVQNYF